MKDITYNELYQHLIIPKDAYNWDKLLRQFHKGVINSLFSLRAEKNQAQPQKSILSYCSKRRKVLELTPRPTDVEFPCCHKSTRPVKRISAIQLSSRNRVMSLRRISCCFMSLQCLMRMSTDSSGMPITGSPEATSAGRVFFSSLCPMIAGQKSIKVAGPQKRR